MLECQKRANKKYKDNHSKTIAVAFYQPDLDVAKWLLEKGNASGYIKSLLRKQMENEKLSK